MSFVIPAAAKRVLIAANPRSGSRPGGDRVQQLTSLLLDRGFAVQTVTDLDRVSRLADQWHRDGELRTLVAAGGDGTVAEIVNRTDPGVAISVFPLGTANLLATYLRVGADPLALARMIFRGKLLRLDAGLAGKRVFLLMMGCGFDADVVQRLHLNRRGHISYWTYAKPILQSIRKYPYPELRVYCDPAPGACMAVNSPLLVRWAFVVNLPNYAGGLQLAPQAVATDGKLDLCAFRGGSLFNGLRYLSYVLLRRQKHLADCSMALSCRLRIESDHHVPYQLDGDPGGFLPLDIEVLPGRLTLVAPAESVAAHQIADSQAPSLPAL